jgi:hypothetical protein
MRPSVLVVVAVVACLPRIARAQGNPMGPEFHVNTFTTGYQRFPTVASDSSGNFVVVWSSTGQDGSNDGVFAQRYASSGVPLGPEFRVNTYTTSIQHHPAVASDASGNFVIVWDSFQQDGSGYGVFAQRYGSSGAPLGSEFRVNTYTTSYQRFPSVAADSSGSFVVAWESIFQGGFPGASIFGQRYTSSGAPLGQEFPINSFTFTTAAYSVVASDAAGDFVVVWVSFGQDGSGQGIFGQRYASSGTALGPEFRVNTVTATNQYKPSVAMAAAGDFVVVWANYYTAGLGNLDVFAQRYKSTGAPLGGEFRVNTSTSGFQTEPVVASDPSGNFVVAWQGGAFAGPSGYDIIGQRYSSSGAPLGSEFRVNTFTTDAEVFPAVAADSAGNFVVVWESQAQEGASFGIYGQRYSQIVPVELIQVGIE